MSPSTQISSTAGRSWQTASSAARLAWMSERTARRMGVGVYRRSAERPPARLPGTAGGARRRVSFLAGDHEPMSTERREAGVHQLDVSAAQCSDRRSAASQLLVLLV